jgi:hypothetical protein
MDYTAHKPSAMVVSILQGSCCILLHAKMHVIRCVQNALVERGLAESQADGK